MRADALLRNTCLLASIACLSGAYLVSGYWLILPLIAAVAVFRLALRRSSAFWRSSSLLVSYVAIAAVGVQLGLSELLLVLGMAAALAAWDLANFAESLNIAADPKFEPGMWRSHYQSLFPALGVGILLASAASIVQLSLPFALVAAVALALVASLTRLEHETRDGGRGPSR